MNLKEIIGDREEVRKGKEMQKKKEMIVVGYYNHRYYSQDSCTIHTN